MKIRTMTAAGSVLIGACASVPRASVASVLPSAELAVVSVLLKQEARHPERPRPILVLTPTEPTIPADSMGERPVEFPVDQWEEQMGPLPPALREANRKPYSLAGVELPPEARLFPRMEFERAYESAKSFQALVKRLGGLEPLVLKVSRPSFAADGTATILLHVQATWSGCGGINAYVVRSGSETAELHRGLVIW
jgi:hypothetical protein